MILKVLNGFAQGSIVILALVLVTTITTKHTQNLALEDFQNKVNERFEINKTYYDGKIKNLEDTLNTYQSTREGRAKLYAQRLDELYNLYKQNPDPIDKATGGRLIGIEIAEKIPTKPADNYLEQRLNKVEDKVDSNQNRVSARLDIVEQRVLNIQGGSRASNIKVVNNNLNSNTINK
jgi:hypothetical protein